jgi:hypothetical protein
MDGPDHLIIELESDYICDRSMIHTHFKNWVGSWLEIRQSMHDDDTFERFTILSTMHVIDSVHMI